MGARPPPAVRMRYSEVVRQGLAELLDPGLPPTAHLQLAVITFGRALSESHGPHGGELRLAMEAVADAAPQLAAAVQAADDAAGLLRFVELVALLMQMMELVGAAGGPFVERHAERLCELALALAGAPAFEAVLAAPQQQEQGLAILAVTSRLLRQVVDTLAEHHAAGMRYFKQARAGACSPAAMLSVLGRWASACGTLRSPALSSDLARQALLAAHTGLFLALQTLDSSRLYAAERAALAAPEQQQRFATALVAALEDLLLAGPPPGGEDPSDWTDGVWNALRSSELPVFKLGMYDASPDAPGLCCPGRAQRLMDAAHAALAAVPLATPEGRPEAAHAFFVATLALATCGLADWALPQWAEEEKEHGGVCSCARCGGSGGPARGGKKKKKGKKKKHAAGSSGGSARGSNSLPQAPTHEALLASLRAIPAAVRAISALLEQHSAFLAKPEIQRAEDETLAALHLAWAAKACVRLGWVLRSRACTRSAEWVPQAACAWRTAAEPDGSADPVLREAGVAAAEALLRLGACLATSSAKPPACEADKWAVLPSKALDYAELLLEPTLRPVRLHCLEPTPALQRSALGLALSTAKAVLVLAPLAGPAFQQGHRGARLARKPPPVDTDLLGRLLSAVCYDTCFTLAPSIGREEEDDADADDDDLIFVPDEEATPAAAAAISLSHALNSLLPVLADMGHDEDETVEGILGPMLAPLAAVATGPAPPLMAEHALGRRACANLDCTRLSGASEWDVPSQRCSQCHAVAFCCRECQRIAWPQHRTVCAALAAAQ